MSRTFKRKKKRLAFKPDKDVLQTIKEAGYRILETPKGGQFHIHPERDKP
jgi:hypothetical protein